MIEINLLPPNLKKKRKRTGKQESIIPLEIVIGLGGGLIFLLIGVHVLLLLINLGKMASHQSLKMQWDTIQPAKQNVDKVIEEMRMLRKRYAAVETITEEKGAVWSQKLNIISDVLPRGVWLRKIALTTDVLFIEGSAISKKKQEMIDVHSFRGNLKEEGAFLKGLKDLELGSIQRRNVSNIEIADFLITCELNHENQSN